MFESELKRTGPRIAAWHSWSPPGRSRWGGLKSRTWSSYTDTPEALLRVAAAVERQSQHPLALATVGIAMGGAGTANALETADVALTADDVAHPPVCRGPVASGGAWHRTNPGALDGRDCTARGGHPGWLAGIGADRGITRDVRSRVGPRAQDGTGDGGSRPCHRERLHADTDSGDGRT